ncbi:MAG: inositol 2-dehydrogenase [Candidatus Neomarinimicrobiota bacterium]
MNRRGHSRDDRQVVAGLIGAGRIGKMHASNIQLYLPEVLLKSVVDIDLDEAWARKSGIPVKSLSAKEVYEDPEIEAVVIAASSTAHVDLILGAAQAGKHIFCEKPVAFDPGGVSEAVEAARTAGVKLQVGFNRRFDPDFRKVREIVERGAVGAPHIITITNRDPVRPDLEFVPKSGGLFLDFCIHDFDTARFLTGSEVEEVFAMGAVLIDPALERLGDIDTALITLKMSDGALCIIDNSRETHYGYDQRVEVFGSLGSVRADNTRPTGTTLSTETGVFMDKPHYSFVERFKEAFVQEIKEFFDCIRNETDPSVTGEDAVAAINIATAAALSRRENKPVRVQG